MQDRGRVIADVGKNIPSSKSEFELFPPDRFPIRLHFIFSRKNCALTDSFKAVLKDLPKDKVRHRVAPNRYVGCISLRCYFNDMETFEIAVSQLNGENLWTGGLLDDAQVSVQDLINHACQHVPLF